ncbi:hypothetical protein, partial [Stenotrophomonas geniculata]|uniref:hypothetical protein n=3 Tax=Stenotrophomonas TaxID=40323 RepID=UPI001E493338
LPDFHQIRLGSRIHAADTPAYPTRPASDRFRRSATHGEEKEDQKRIATLRLLVSRAWIGSTQGNEATRQAAFAFDLLFLLRGRRARNLSVAG